MRTLDNLKLARREVELFSDEWRAARVDECKQYDQIVVQGLFVWRKILLTDEMYRALMSDGRMAYVGAIDAQLFSLMRIWLDVSEEVLTEIENLRDDGFSVSNAAEFDRCIAQSREMFAFKGPENVVADFDKLVRMSREGFDRFDQPAWWDDAPTHGILRVLRYRNMESAGIVGDELIELSNIDRYPGTLLAELREPIICHEAEDLSNAIEWSSL